MLSVDLKSPVLSDIARAVSISVQSTNISATCEVNSFLLIMPHTDSGGASKVITRVRGAIERIGKRTTPSPAIMMKIAAILASDIDEPSAKGVLTQLTSALR